MCPLRSEQKMSFMCARGCGGRAVNTPVDGDVFEEGEYISDDLMLRRVEEEQVWFVYRGLTLIRTL